MRASIVIIGGGVMGTSIALQAARRSDPLSEPVLLLERRELAAGSSGRSGAILRQHYTDRELAGMARDSLRVYSTFLERTGHPIGFQSTGVLTLAGPENPESMERVRTNVAMHQSIGIDTRVVDADEIRELVPGIVVGDENIAAYEPGAGFVDAVRTVEAFAALARYRGATTRCGVDVTGIVVEKDRVVGVETTDGSFEARQVVLAAGPWAPRFLAELGVELPLRVLKPQQYFIEMPDPMFSQLDTARERALEDPDLDPRLVVADETPPAAHPVLLDLERGNYGRCEPSEGRTRTGKMDYSDAEVLADPDAMDEVVSEEFSRWARAELARRMPIYEGRPDVGVQAGWYTVTPDAQAMLGPVPGIEGLFLAAGFSGHGFKLAPSIGEGLTQMLFDEPVSAFAPEFFSPERFLRKDVEWRGQFGL
jgi:glycine/D-amino acid oxidase-like deaminating enzyme